MATNDPLIYNLHASSVLHALAQLLFRYPAHHLVSFPDHLGQSLWRHGDCVHYHLPHTGITFQPPRGRLRHGLLWRRRIGWGLPGRMAHGPAGLLVCSDCQFAAQWPHVARNDAGTRFRVDVLYSICYEPRCRSVSTGQLGGDQPALHRRDPNPLHIALSHGRQYRLDGSPRGRRSNGCPRLELAVLGGRADLYACSLSRLSFIAEHTLPCTPPRRRGHSSDGASFPLSGPPIPVVHFTHHVERSHIYAAPLDRPGVFQTNVWLVRSPDRAGVCAQRAHRFYGRNAPDFSDRAIACPPLFRAHGFDPVCIGLFGIHPTARRHDECIAVYHSDLLRRNIRDAL